MAWLMARDWLSVLTTKSGRQQRPASDVLEVISRMNMNMNMNMILYNEYDEYDEYNII